MREFKVAVRRLIRQPSFAFAAIGTLALGIAAPTALFAVVNATLLRPLPYPRAQDIYTVRTTMTDGRFTIGLVASEELSTLRRTTQYAKAQRTYFRRDKRIHWLRPDKLTPEELLLTTLRLAREGGAAPAEGAAITGQPLTPTAAAH